MCRHLTVVIDCACNNRVIEIYEKFGLCDCVIEVLFHSFEVSFCYNCKSDDRTLHKLYNLLEFFLSYEPDMKLYYNEDPCVCVEKVFR